MGTVIFFTYVGDKSADVDPRNIWAEIHILYPQSGEFCIRIVRVLEDIFVIRLTIR